MEAKDYIAEIRLHSQLTQAEISDRTGIPQPTISKIERGEVKDVMSRNYRAIQELHKSVVLKGKSATVDEETNRLMAEGIKAGVIKDRRDPSRPGRRDLDVKAYAALGASTASGQPGDIGNAGQEV